MGKRRPGAGPKRFRHLIELWVIKLFGSGLRILPYRSVVNLANSLGVLAFEVVRIRRKVTLSNLQLALGQEKTLADLKKIGRRCYQLIARSFLEHLYLPRLKREELLNLVGFDTLQPFQKAVDGGKGGVLASAHFGSWQIMGVAVAQHNFPMNFLVQQQGNAAVDELAYSYVRDKGVGVLYRKFSARKVMDYLTENKFVAMLPDQDAGKRGVLVQFFGQPASVHKGAAYFAIKSKAPIIIGFMVSNSSGKHQAFIQDLYYPKLSGNLEEDMQKTMQEITSRIEDFVRKYPEHWFWPHRRWKSTLGKR